VFIISSDGGVAKRLSSETVSETRPHWSRDGRSIYYSSNASGTSEIWKKPIAGGPSIQITHGGGLTGQESFDGRSLYYTADEVKPGLWRQPLDGGPEEKVASQLPARVWVIGERPRMASTSCASFGKIGRSRKRSIFTTRPHARCGKWRVFRESRCRGNAGLAVSPDERSIYFVQVDRWGVGIYFAEDITW